MTDYYPYIALCSCFHVYLYEIPGLVNHAGFHKVGDASLKSPKEGT